MLRAATAADPGDDRLDEMMLKCYIPNGVASHFMSAPDGQDPPHRTNMRYPRFLRVRQNFPDHRLIDIAGEVRRQLCNSRIASRLRTGSDVAIGVGSRGIRNIDVIVRETVRQWKDLGMRPFLFPAMGSHGAATAEGQAKVLAHYGITEATMSCPVVSSLDVVSLGKTADGIEVFMDRTAYESAGVMLVARVKWHTDFTGRIESGLFKMMAVGLGKLAGAQSYHAWAYRRGLESVILSVGRRMLDSGKILGGLAILEDAYHNTARLDAIPAADLESREAEDLALVKSWMGRIPTDLDILIVDEMGKDISGTGMDTKVINRSVHAHYNPFPEAPRIERVFVRDLSELSYNNGLGIGLADITTDRLVDRIDSAPTRLNALASSGLANVRVPIHCPTDRECLELVAPTVGKTDLDQVTYGWIRNTLQLSELMVSENLKPQIAGNPGIDILGDPVELPFDAEGNLVSPRCMSGVGTVD